MSDPNREPNPPGVDTYLVQAMFVVTFCLCGSVLAIPGLVMGFRCASALDRGDLEAARYYSDRARFWTKLGFWTGLATLVVGLLVGLGGWLLNR